MSAGCRLGSVRLGGNTRLHVGSTAQGHAPIYIHEFFNTNHLKGSHDKQKPTHDPQGLDHAPPILLLQITTSVSSPLVPSRGDRSQLNRR